MLSCSADGTLRRWDISTGACLQVFQGHRGWVMDFAVSADVNWLYSAGMDSQYIKWNLMTGAKVHECSDTDNCISRVATCCGGSIVALGCWNGTILIYNSESDKLMHSIRAHSGKITNMFAAHRLLFSAGQDHVLRIWDPVKGSCAFVLRVGKEITSVTRESNIVYIGCKDGAVRRFVLPRNKQLLDMLVPRPVSTMGSPLPLEDFSLAVPASPASPTSGEGHQLSTPTEH